MVIRAKSSRVQHLYAPALRLPASCCKHMICTLQDELCVNAIPIGFLLIVRTLGNSGGHAINAIWMGGHGHGSNFI